MHVVHSLNFFRSSQILVTVHLFPFSMACRGFEIEVAHGYSPQMYQHKRNLVSRRSEYLYKFHFT